MRGRSLMDISEAASSSCLPSSNAPVADAGDKRHDSNLQDLCMHTGSTHTSFLMIHYVMRQVSKGMGKTTSRVSIEHTANGRQRGNSIQHLVFACRLRKIKLEGATLTPSRPLHRAGTWDFAQDGALGS
eukprot:822494-Pelagomonas_calceolata.AAC.11